MGGVTTLLIGPHTSIYNWVFWGPPCRVSNFNNLQDGTVRLWSVERHEGFKPMALLEHRSPVRGVFFSEDLSYLEFLVFLVSNVSLFKNTSFYILFQSLFLEIFSILVYSCIHISFISHIFWCRYFAPTNDPVSNGRTFWSLWIVFFSVQLLSWRTIHQVTVRPWK